MLTGFLVCGSAKINSVEMNEAKSEETNGPEGNDGGLGTAPSPGGMSPSCPKMQTNSRPLRRLGPVANTDTKLLIYGLFQKSRVLAQEGMPCSRAKTLDPGPGQDGNPVGQGRTWTRTC